MPDQNEARKDQEARDRAKRAEMQGWIRSTFADPEFRGLSGTQKIQIMENADPEFKAIPSIADKARVVQSYMYQIPKRMPSTGSAWKDFAQGFAGEALRPGVTALDIGRKAMGKQPIGQRPEVQYLLEPPESLAGKAGAIAEPVVETMLLPELRATKVPKLLESGEALMRAGKPVLRETLPSLARRSVFEGAKMGTQAELHGDKPVPGAILGASMPIIGATLNSVVKPEVQRTAEWLYNRALNPTKKITKGETAEVVPELLQRRFWASTFPRLHEKAEANLSKAEANLIKTEDQVVRDFENTYVVTGRYRTVRKPGTPATSGPVIDIYAGEAAPPGTPQIGVGTSVGPARANVGPRVTPEAEGFGGTAASSNRIYETQKGAFSIEPVLGALRDVMRSTHIGGAFPTKQSEILYGAALDQYQRLRQFGRFVPLRNAIKIRRILDKPLGQKGTFYESDPTWQSLERVQEIAANKLRGLINDNFPELAEANHEYHLWKSATHIMDETKARKIGQIGLVHLLATAGGAGAGVWQGRDWEAAVKGALFANAVAAVAESPGLKTMAGVNFQRLADAMDTRNLDGFLQAAGTLVRPKQEREEVQAPPSLGPGSKQPPRAAAAAAPTAAAAGGAGAAAAPAPAPEGFPPARGETLAPAIAQAIQRFEGWAPGSVSQRNNNPGNLKPPPGQDLPGMTGRDEQGFAIFRDYAAGWNALVGQVERNVNRGLSLNEFFSGGGAYPGYAPAGDRNRPQEYAATVGSWLRIDPTTPLSSLR